MAGERGGAVSRPMQSLFVEGTLRVLSDGQLVSRYLARGDALAFEVLVERHAAMVQAVCRRSLADPADVDDAFQATFLVLARRSATVRDRDELGGWLFGVSRRVCLLANRARIRRRGHERRAAEERSLRTAARAVDDELAAAIDEEIERLPRPYRLPVVLCLLEGRTRSEAAAQLRWTEGMVRGRLARARALLRSRLTRRGLAPAGVLAALARERTADGAVPRAWIENAARNAVARRAAAGLVSAESAALAQGVIRTMMLKNLAAAVLALIAVAGLTACATSLVAGEDKPKAAAPAQGSAADAPFPEPTPAGKLAPSKQREALNRSRTNVFTEVADFDFWRAKAQLELQSLQAQVEAKKAEIAQRESEMKVKRLARDLALYEALEKAVPMRFAKETPVEDVLKYIKQESRTPALPNGLPIYVDPEGLHAAGKTMTSPVQIELEDVPLATTLRLICKQLGLSYQLKDGLLTISADRSFQ